MELNIINLGLISVWASYVILTPIVTSIFKSKKTNWGNFWLNWVIVSIISGFIVIAFLFMPEKILSVFNSILGNS